MMSKLLLLCFLFIISSETLVAFPIQSLTFGNKVTSRVVPVLDGGTITLEGGQLKRHFKDRSDFEDGSIDAISAPANGNIEDVVESMTAYQFGLKQNSRAATAFWIVLLLWCWDPSVALAHKGIRSWNWEHILIAYQPVISGLIINNFRTEMITKLDSFRTEMITKLDSSTSEMITTLDSFAEQIGQRCTEVERGCESIGRQEDVRRLDGKMNSTAEELEAK